MFAVGAMPELLGRNARCAICMPRVFGDANMPWTPNDARKHTKKAKGAKAKRTFATVANAVLAKTGDDGRAIRAANSAVARRKTKRSKS
jgi:hypothetical protein